MLIGQAMGLDLKRGRERETLLEAIRRLGQAVGVDQTLGQIGLLRSDIPQLSRKAMQDACMVTNPRRPTQREVEAIYESAF
jgi:alcohol dehydrogenase class IV